MFLSDDVKCLHRELTTGGGGGGGNEIWEEGRDRDSKKCTTLCEHFVGILNPKTNNRMLLYEKNCNVASHNAPLPDFFQYCVNNLA